MPLTLTKVDDHAYLEDSLANQQFTREPTLDWSFQCGGILFQNDSTLTDVISYSWNGKDVAGTIRVTDVWKSFDTIRKTKVWLKTSGTDTPFRLTVWRGEG